jgi:hypothetical protein
MKKRVKITLPNKLPKAVYGMNVTGKVNNADGSQTSEGKRSLLYENSNAPVTAVNRTLKPTERENATLEAEKGETVVTNLAQTGIPEFYTIGGKRHHSGGTPLSLPPDSFIFSRDRKLFVKDKDILEQFGKTVGKKGKKKFSFADLSKKFDNGMYREILADPSSDRYQIETAQMMIKNYNLKLGALALVQESKKGFPDGIPGISMPYLEHTGMDPSKFELPKMNMGGQAPQPMMNYGGMPMGDYNMPMFAPGGPNIEGINDEGGVDLNTVPAYGNYNFQGLGTDVNAIDDYYASLLASGKNINREDFFNAWNASPGGKQLPYSTDLNPSPLGTRYAPIQQGYTPPPAKEKAPIKFFHSTPGQNIPYSSQTQVNRYGGMPKYYPGGPTDNVEVRTAESLSDLEFEPTQGMLDAVQPSAPAVWDYAAQQKYIGSPDYVPGGGEGRGNLYQQGIVDYFTSQGTGGGRAGGEQFFKDVARDTGEVYSYTESDGTSKWDFDRTATDALAAQKQAEAVAKQQASDKARGFVPGFKYEDGKLFQKRQGKKTGTEHWETSNPVMAKMYAKKYGTGELSGKELTQQIKENPEAFASSWGQQAAQDAQLAAITLKKFGGDSNIPMFAPGGVNEADYTTEADAYGSPEEQALLEQAYTQGYMDPPGYGWNQPNKRRVRVTMPGTEPQTSSRATSYQDIPKSDRKWDMNAEGYDEASVQPGDYVKKTDGKWYKTESVERKTTPYEGGLDERLGDLGEAYGRLEKRLLGNEKLQNALYTKYKENMAKAKPRNNLSEADLKAARKLSKKQVVDNFLRAQKQIMAVQSKGPLENADAWDKDLGHYNKAMTDMNFTPMNAAETAAFQGAYISMQNLADADPKFRKELNDFNISKDTRKGKGDEPGGGTGRSTISDIDGWFGNTTIGESMLYAPKATELQMKEVEWKKIKDTPEVKHLRNQFGPQKTPFWTEDIVNLGFAAKNLFGIRKEQPWMGKPFMKLPRATFLTPDQQIQNILGAQAKGIRGASNIGSPQAYAATIASIQANAMQNVANSIGNVHDMNVKIANMFEDKRVGIINNARIRDMQLATSMHDKNAILNQQFRNSKNKAWDVVRRMGNNMWTNRGKTQNLNTFTDQYDIDPRTGYKHFTDPRALRPTDSQRPDLAGRINQLVSDVPGLTPDQAGKLIAKENGFQPMSPTGRMGMDPYEMATGYPQSAPEGYYGG